VNVEDVDIQISLTGEWWRDPPFCEIYIDDKVIDRVHVSNKLNDEISTREVNFRGNLSYGDHKLTIRYLNKKEDDDLYDDDGISIYHQSLMIEKIIINRLKINVYKQRSNMMFHNGDWILDFSVPTYLWLMENT
jgi:hypothetical protein